MTHPLFKKDMFVETAFAKRFQKMLYAAWDNRASHLLVADPGAGKTMSIRDLQKRAGARSVLAVVAPKNNDDEQALGDQFVAALGLPIRGHWSMRKPKIMGHLHQYGTECLIVDDAHDLSLEHLMLLKEVTDQGRLQYDLTRTFVLFFQRDANLQDIDGRSQMGSGFPRHRSVKFHPSVQSSTLQCKIGPPFS